MLFYRQRGWPLTSTLIGCRAFVARTLETICQVEPTAGPDLEPEPALLLACAAIALILATVGALVATALLTYSPSKLARRLNAELESSAVKSVHTHSANYQVIARLVSICGIIAAVLLTWTALPSHRVSGIAVMSTLSVLFCGVIPASVAEPRAEHIIAVARRFLVPMHQVLFLPVVLPMAGIARLVMRILRISTRPPTAAEEIAEEIADAVSDSTHENELDEDERGWIENIVELKDQHANQVMTPRTDIVAFEASMPLLEAVRRATMAGHSRYPVYEEKLDQIVGMFYAKDALTLVGRDSTDEERVVREFIRKPLFVNENIDLGLLLQQFRSSKVQMAVLLDEYGGTVGLVSIEDILEEIIGDITDEYDTEEGEVIKVVEEHRVIETAGRTRVETINDYLDAQIPVDQDYDTVAGFVLNGLDRVPKQNEVIYEMGLEIRILSADDRRIDRVRLTLAEPVPIDVKP